MTVQARRGCGQTRMAGAYTDQRLNLSKLWEGPRRKCQGFKPDPGNPAVRDYRGASGNVSHGGNVHPSCNRKSGKRKPPTYSGARPISIPISSHRLHPPLQNRVRPGALNRSHLLNAETWQTAIESRVVATITDLDRLFAEIKREKGKLDIVFANAGVAKYALFGEITGDLYEQTFGINVKGVLFTVQKALPLVP